MKLTEKIIDQTIRKNAEAQATYVTEEITDVVFSSSRLKSSRSDYITKLHLKVKNNGKTGHSYTRNKNDIDGLIAKAFEAAGSGSPAHYEFPARSGSADVKLYDNELLPVSKNDMALMNSELIDTIKEYNPDVTINSGAQKKIKRTEFSNSNGQSYSCEETYFNWGIEAQLIKKTDMLFVYQDFSARKRSDISHREIARKIITLIKMSRRTAKIRSGGMPVILAPECAELFGLPLALGINGKNAFFKSSPLTDRIGEKIADDSVTIMDNPLIDFAQGSRKYDSEGVPCRKTCLIEKGILKNFLYDLETAGKAGAESTGSSPGCGISNIDVSEGQVSFNDMIKSVKEGLLVYTVIGLGDSNVMSGDFSVNVGLGYKIENGETAGRVKDVMISGNFYDALKNMEAIGNKAEWTAAEGFPILSPPVKIGKLSVTAG